VPNYGLQNETEMNSNRIKEKTAEEQTEEKPVRKKSPSRISKWMTQFMNMFGIFNRNQIVNSMPFILFLAFIAIMYIANSYYAEGIIRDIEKTKLDLRERRAEYISIMSRLMYQRNQSEIAKALASFEIKESTEPPSKIFVKSSEK
jgi:hypothetical protein